MPVKVRELVDKYESNKKRIGEIADLCEKEKRERNEAENAEYSTLVRENEIISMKLRAIENPSPAAVPSATEQLREIVNSGRVSGPVSIEMVRDVTLNTTSAVADTGIIHVQQEEMLKPLRAGLIWEKLGLHVCTGLPGQTIRWPKHSKLVAKWADEGERAVDQNINFSALTTAPRRLTVATPITKELLDSTAGVVESTVRSEMPAAVVDAINEMLFNTTGKYTASDMTQKDRKIVGPLVKAAKTPVEFAAEVPTRKELLKMKAKVLAAGVEGTAFCWVMTEAMKAELEDVKVDAGSGRFLCENDRILGYPVFTTAAIGEGNIAFGEWSYQAAGFFGPISIGVDPYTLLRQNATDFVLNAHFATATLYDEAFVLGHKKTQG